MNKSKLVDVIAEKRKLPRKKAEQVVDLVFDMLVDALKRDDRIEVRGFGSFVTKKYGAYKGRNPRSGEPIDVPAKRVPFFKVGKELRERVDHSTAPLQPDTDDDRDSTPPPAAPATSSEPGGSSNTPQPA
ncbi:MAG: HU family DNA-binding protein [Myxococcota bacterium]